MSADLYELTPEQIEAGGVPGWIEAPDEVDRICAAQPIPIFEDSPAGQAKADTSVDFSFHDCARIVTGSMLPIRSQGNAGTCVGFGITRGVEFILLFAIAVLRKSFLFPKLGVAVEPTYGGSKVEVGRGRIRGDGSIVAWAAEFVKRWGICPRQVYADYGFDLSTYSIPICREWGARGVPDKFEPFLKQYPVGAVSKCLTVEGAAKALQQGYAVVQGSNILMRPRRGPNGIAEHYRGGGHCTAYPGVVWIGGEPFFQEDNSWGAGAHTGPQHPKFPYDGGGLCPPKIMEQRLAQGDTMVLGDVVGFPQREAVDFSQIG